MTAGEEIDMAMEYHAPSKGVALNAAASVAGLYATRNEFIGWGPPIADAFRGAKEHPDAFIALFITGALVLYAHWRFVLKVVGFRETPGARWSSDAAMSNEILEWMRRRSNVTDKTLADRAKFKRDLSFVFAFEPPDKRPVTVMKLATSNSLQFSTRIAPSPEHAASIKAMDEADYRAMLDDIALEIVKAGIPVGVLARIIPERGPEKDEDGDEIPAGVFMAEILPATSVTEPEFMEAINLLRRGILIVQVIIRKHIAWEDARRGRLSAPIDISPALSVVASSTATDEV